MVHSGGRVEPGSYLVTYDEDRDLFLGSYHLELRGFGAVAPIAGYRVTS